MEPTLSSCPRTKNTPSSPAPFSNETKCNGSTRIQPPQVSAMPTPSLQLPFRCYKYSKRRATISQIMESPIDYIFNRYFHFMINVVCTYSIQVFVEKKVLMCFDSIQYGRF